MSRDWSLTPEKQESAVRRRIAEITPEEVPERGPGDSPRVVFIAGQPGAGKTTTQDIVQRELGESQVALYDGDENAMAHSNYEDIVRENPFDGHGIADQHLPDDAHQRYMNHLRSGETKYDMVVSHPLGKKEWAEAWTQGFSDEGYHTSVAFIATHESNSLLSTADRYQVSRDERGHGRWVERETHDRFYNEIPDVAHHLESRGLVDSMYVTTRDGELIYENHKGADGQMVDPPGAREAIIAERSRPPTQAETDYFNSRVAYLSDKDRLGPEQEAEPISGRVADTRDGAADLHERHRELSADRETSERSDKGLSQSLRQQAATDRQTPREQAPSEKEHTAPESEPTPSHSEDVDTKLQKIQAARETRGAPESRSERKTPDLDRDRRRDAPEPGPGRESPDRSDPDRDGPEP